MKTFVGIDLDLVTVDCLNFQHSLARPDIQSIDVIPPVDLGLGDGFGSFEEGAQMESFGKSQSTLRVEDSRFLRGEGRYIDASGQSFRDFLDGRLPALPGETPTMSDARLLSRLSLGSLR